MKFITVSEEFAKMCETDIEFLKKSDIRPHLLVLSLKYKGQKRTFAVPLRSNISPTVPKNQYFSLPPRSKTKPGHRHGLHYIKMFPIEPKYWEKFWVGEKDEYVLYQSIIQNNIASIVSECQRYLSEYENGIRPEYSVNIDRIIEILNREQ